MTSQSVKIVLTLAINSILAHLLTPEDFGLIAMAMVFVNLAGLLNDMGLQSALIQKRNADEPHVSSAFWLNLTEGILLSACLAALAPLIARFYGESRLALIVLAISPTFTVASLGMIQAALIQKRLDFRTLAVADIISLTAGGATATGLAFGGAGVWSLVALSLVSMAVYACVVSIASEWRPSLVFSRKSARELLGFGLPLMGNSFANYFNRNLDNMLIGKFLGGEQLGFYSLAYKLLLFPLQNVSNTIGQVMFPALSMIQEDHARVRGAYLRATRYIAFLTFPAMAGLALVAPQFVRVFFGPQWERSIFIVRVLSCVGLVQSVGTTVGWIYLSQGRTDVMLRWTVFALSVVATSFAVGLIWEIEGVAVSYAIASFLLVYPLFAIPFRLIGLRFTSFLDNFRTITASTIVMAAVVRTTIVFLSTYTRASDIFLLASAIVVGASVYALFLLVADRQACRDALALAASLFRGRADSAQGAE